MDHQNQIGAGAVAPAVAQPAGNQPPAAPPPPPVHRAPNNNVVIIPNNPPQARFDLCNLAAADPSGLEIMPYLAEEY